MVGLISGLLVARRPAPRRHGAPWITPLPLAFALLLGGCSGDFASPWQDQHWYGYFYRDLRVNGAPELSVAYPDARACLAGMQAYMTKAPATAGYSCARGCPAARDGYVVDCREVAR
jgi:hypothetical protein